MKKTILVLFFLMTAISAFALDPVLRNQTYVDQVKTFDRVESIANYSLAATEALTPSDVTATNTADVAWYPTRGITYPFELEIQVTGDNPLYYNIYSADAAGVDVPDEDNGAVLMDVNGAKCTGGKHAKLRFYRKPNISFGSGGTNTATATFIIRSIKNITY